MKQRRYAVAMLLAMAMSVPTVQAQSEGSRASVRASEGLSQAASTVVAGSASLLVGGAVLVVDSVQQVGEALLVVLRPVAQGASEVSMVTLRFAASAVGNASLAAGASVQVVAEASGQALYLAGKLIAFIPNEIGKSMVHHSPVKGQQ